MTKVHKHTHLNNIQKYSVRESTLTESLLNLLQNFYLYHMTLVMKTLGLFFLLTRFNTNQSVQPQKKDIGFEFWIFEAKGFYYL